MPPKSFVQRGIATPTQAAAPGSPLVGTPGGAPAQGVLKVKLSEHGGRRDIACNENGLLFVLERYRYGTINTTDKRKQSKGTVHLLSTMESICTQLGEWSKDDGRQNPHEGNLESAAGVN